MVKLKRIELNNYCGYRKAVFDFTDGHGKPKNLACFYGPNGCGKTSLLAAIELVSSAHRLYGKDVDLLFRKMIYNQDYDPASTEYAIKYAKESSFASENFKTAVLANVQQMELSAVFDTDDGDKLVRIASDGVKDNELPPDMKSYCYYIDADHPMNIQKFQLLLDMEETFLDIAETVYGYKCELGKRVTDLGGTGETYYTDFVLIKPDGTRVHYRRMSGGEKKIATLLRHLCNPLYIDATDIIVLDNAMKEIYFKRHIPVLDKLLSSFPTKQFFIVTHSGVLVDYIDENLLYEVERYKYKASNH